jgi:hypothetical protein
MHIAKIANPMLLDIVVSIVSIEPRARADNPKRCRFGAAQEPFWQTDRYQDDPAIPTAGSDADEFLTC